MIMNISLQLKRPRSQRSGLERLRLWVGGSFAPYLYIAPFFLVFIAFGLYPLLYALRLSFTSWHGAGEPQFIGIENYTFLLGNDYFWNSLRNSAVLWLLIVPLQTIMAILAATLLSRKSCSVRSSVSSS